MPGEDIRNSEAKEHGGWSGEKRWKRQRRKAGEQQRIRAALCQAGKGRKLVHKKDLASRVQPP